MGGATSATTAAGGARSTGEGAVGGTTRRNRRHGRLGSDAPSLLGRGGTVGHGVAGVVLDVGAEVVVDARELRARDGGDLGAGREGREDLGRVLAYPRDELAGVAAVSWGDGGGHGDVAGVFRGREVDERGGGSREGGVEGDEGLDAAGEAPSGLAGFEVALEVVVAGENLG